MLEHIWINKLDGADLNMYQCGIEDCRPAHSYGPAVRDHFLIHYINSGKGIFQVGNTTYHLEKNQGFLICPGVVTYYQADSIEPWSYSWVGFHGLKAEVYLKQANLTAANPIFRYEKDNFPRSCISEMIATKKLSKGRDIKLLGLLYVFLSHLVEESQGNKPYGDNPDRKELYVRKTVEFIGKNFSRNISVEEISHYIGLDRSYLGSLFKSYFNVSTQEFIINFRIGKACELMKNNSLSIGDISRSVGYDDPLLFSKMFKKMKGVSPRKFREEMASQQPGES